MFARPLQGRSTKAKFITQNIRPRTNLSFPSRWYCAHTKDLVVESNVIYLRNELTGTEIFLIGTCHISEESATEVQKLIRSLKPDTVMVELDKDRAAKLKSQHGKVSDQEFARAVVPSLFGSSSSSSMFQAFITQLYHFFRSLGIIPGKEFLVAMEEAEKINAHILLGDRNSQVTLHRAFDQFSFLELIQRVLQQAKKGNRDLEEFSRILLSGGKGADWILQFVHKLTNRENVRVIRNQFRDICPTAAIKLIDERDIYMVNQLRQSRAKRIVAVVGMGHLDGMEEYWASHKTRADELQLSEYDLDQP